MTGLIGGRWTAGNRLEPSRPNGRGRIPLMKFTSGVVARHRGGPCQGEVIPPLSARTDSLHRSGGHTVEIDDVDMQGAWAIRQELAEVAVDVAQHRCAKNSVGQGALISPLVTRERRDQLVPAFSCFWLGPCLVHSASQASAFPATVSLMPASVARPRAQLDSPRDTGRVFRSSCG